MARPIDAEQYMELLKEQYLHNKFMNHGEAAKAWQGAMQLLYDMPTLTPPNEPLTLDELREMVGCWVWVIVTYQHERKTFQCDGWALVETPARIAYLDQEFQLTELGTRFQAYTQPVSNFRVRFMRNREGMAADEESE